MNTYSISKNILLIILFTGTYAQSKIEQHPTSSVQCVSGSSDSKNIINQLKEAKQKTKLTQIIYNQYHLNKKTEAATTVDPTCPTGDCLTASVKSEPFLKVRSAVLRAPEAPQLAFKNECLLASTSFTAGAPEISCPTGTKSKTINQCITQEQVTYQNAVLSSFVNCAIKEGFTGVSLNSIFQKFSLESGFKPQYVSGDGTGMGQLTSIFIDDIHQKHRGFKYLKKIAHSTSPDCEAAKQIASQDILAKPNFSNKCAFTSVGEGLERNILYSLVGTNTLWEMNIEPKMRGYLNKYSQDPKINEAKELALMNAYGRGGPAAANTAIRRLSRFTPEEFIKRMKKPLYTENKNNLTFYTSNITTRQKRIADKLTEPLKTEFSKSGADACLNTY